MLEEKEIIIDEAISKKDKDRVFIVHQIPVTRMKKLEFIAQNIIKLKNETVTIDADKKEELYFAVLDEIECKTKVDNKTVITKLKRNVIDGFIEDVNTMDYLVSEFWRFNLGEGMNPIQKSMNNLVEVY